MATVQQQDKVIDLNSLIIFDKRRDNNKPTTTFDVTDLFLNSGSAMVSIWINTQDTHSLREGRDQLRGLVEGACSRHPGLLAIPNPTFKHS